MTGDSQPSRAEFWTRSLLRDGFYIIHDAVSPALVGAVDRDLDAGFTQAPFCKGEFYGNRTKRFGALLRRSPNIAAFVRHPLILAVAENILGPYCDRFNLNLTQAIEIHPGAPAQFPHCDQDMWPGPKGQIHYLLNVIWPLSKFTAANGGTRLWPRSHRPDAPDREA